MMKKISFSFGIVAISAFYAIFFGKNPAPALPIVTPSSTAQNDPSVAAAGNGIPSTPSLSSNSPTAASGSAPSLPSGTRTQKTPTSAPAPTPTPAPAPKPKPAGQYADGTYTGSPADAYYGMVQVQAVVQNGKLANVQILQYPNTHSTSIYINQQALPYLVQEALQSQNANVNIVSGATDTSMAFQQSLSSALAQAKG